jgi:hypothetical protein
MQITKAEFGVVYFTDNKLRHLVNGRMNPAQTHA